MSTGEARNGILQPGTWPPWKTIRILTLRSPQSRRQPPHCHTCLQDFQKTVKLQHGPQRRPGRSDLVPKRREAPVLPAHSRGDTRGDATSLKTSSLPLLGPPACSHFGALTRSPYVEPAAPSPLHSPLLTGGGSDVSQLDPSSGGRFAPGGSVSCSWSLFPELQPAMWGALVPPFTGELGGAPGTRERALRPPGPDE